MAEWWTKQSFEPFSGVMKPKPLASLNHFTVPVVRMFLLLNLCCGRSPDCRYGRRQLARDHCPHDGLARESGNTVLPKKQKRICANADPLSTRNLFARTIG